MNTRAAAEDVRAYERESLILRRPAFDDAAEAPSHEDEDEWDEDSAPGSCWSRLSLLRAPLLAGIVLVASTQMGKGHHTGGELPMQAKSRHAFSSPLGASSGAGTAACELKLSNAYPPRQSTELYPWMHIAEPHRESTLRLSCGEGEGVSSADHKFTITCETRDGYNESVELLSGSTNFSPGDGVTYTFTRPGCLYTVEVEPVESEDAGAAKASSGNILGSSSGSSSGSVQAFEVACKYVRREIRQLTDADRETFLSALELAHRLDMGNGVERYGTKFKNYEYFTRKHLAQITLEGCTPYHGGDVFLTSHAAFVLEMEQSLQSIDPAIAMPYWDFTLDDAMHGTDWFNGTEIFRSGWFGRATEYDDGENNWITEGRFAYLPVPSNRSAPERNAYGRLTETFNTNPSRYLGRSPSVCGFPYEGQVRLPGCAAVRGARAASNLTEFHQRVEYGFHGLLHMFIGGVWDCGEFSVRKEVERVPEAAHTLLGLTTITNNFWRAALGSGILVCPASCDSEGEGKGEADSFRDCQCSCPSLDARAPDYKTVDDAMVYVLLQPMIMQMALDPITMFSELVEEGWNDVSNATEYLFRGVDLDTTLRLRRFLLRLLCHPGKVAQFATPQAATNDPLFWVTHSTYLPLWDYMRATNSSFTSSGTKAIEEEGAGVVTGWAGKADAEAWFDDGACSGHNWDETLPFSGLWDGDAAGEMYTNQQLMQALHPANVANTYVYEDASFSHCTDDGRD